MERERERERDRDRDRDRQTDRDKTRIVSVHSLNVAAVLKSGIDKSDGMVNGTSMSSPCMLKKNDLTRAILKGVALRKYVSCLCLSVLFYIRVWADFVDLARVRVYIFI